MHTIEKKKKKRCTILTFIGAREMLTIPDASKQLVINVGCESEYVCVYKWESLVEWLFRLVW